MNCSYKFMSEATVDLVEQALNDLNSSSIGLSQLINYINNILGCSLSINDLNNIKMGFRQGIIDGKLNIDFDNGKVSLSNDPNEIQNTEPNENCVRPRRARKRTSIRRSTSRFARMRRARKSRRARALGSSGGRRHRTYKRRTTRKCAMDFPKYP